MRSPALAIAWAFGRRHRRGLIALAGYLIAMGAFRLLFLPRGQAVPMESAETFALVVAAPLMTTFMYFLAVFSFGLDGDLAARRSIYPARMFTLPVTDEALAGWPMLYGAAVVAILWLATRLLAPWPSGVAIPRVWPGLLAAALLAWTQALTWMPYGLPGLRVIVTILALASMDAVVMVALHFETPESVMVAGLAPTVPLAYLVARHAVARARRGDEPDWRGALDRLFGMADLLPRRRSPHSSPASAQAWFEWRRHGWSLPALVALLLPFELALLFVAGSATPVLVTLTLVGVLLTPPFLAAFAAATVRKSSPEGRDSYGLTPFLATRPLTSAALLGANLRMTVRSTLCAWLLVVIATPLAITLSGTWPVLIQRAHRLSEAVGTPRAVVLALLVLAGLLASTWKQLVQGLYLGLSGREWVVKGSVFLTLALLFAVGPLARWVHDDGDVRAAVWRALPWILAALAGLKTVAAAWVATRLHRSRLLADRTLVAGAAGWLAAVLALYALLAWLASTPHVPGYLLLLVAILQIPLVRLSAAPLALAWNRHR